MGVVYKASPLGQPSNCVAIKVLLAGEFASEKLKRRFKAEAELSKKLNHPNIVPVFDVGEVDGLLFYSMGYVEGQELQDMIRAKSLPIRRGVEILVEVARAAHHAHEHGVVHRDLKPSNVLVGADGTPYIMDFGLAKNLESDKGLTKSGVAIGTPYYMPPEQARGSHKEMDARSDVYALGAILYEIATRRVPFTAKTQNELLRKIIEEEPTPLRTVRAGIALPLETICLKALSKDKSDRYDSAEDMAEDLERFLAGEPIHARRPGFWKPWVRKIKRNRSQSVVVAVAILAVFAAVGIIGALHSNYQARMAEESAREAEEDRARKAKDESDAQAREEESKRRLDQEERRKKAERARRSGQDSYAASRSATSYSELLHALERAEEAFSAAIRLQERLGEPNASTVYRRGLVLRLRCSWDRALEDFLLASKSKSHRARGSLAAALVKLRQESDRAGARKLLGECTLADGVSDLDENEEHAAAGVAEAYLAFLSDDYPRARSRLSSLISQGGLGGMAGEANGALAYFERCAGKPLADDVHVSRGLRAADKAVATNKYRYDYLVDRAILRARAERTKEALVDQRSARNLDPDGAWAELADATINAGRRGDRSRMKLALDSAISKARSRSGAAEERVRAFASRLITALRERDLEAQKKLLIDSDRTAQLTFNGSGGAPQSLQLPLSVKPGAYAVVIQVTGATDDLDLFVVFGRSPQLALAEHQADSPAWDETIVLRRDGTPPLRDGIYTIVVQQPPNSKRKFTAELAVKFVSKGEPVPFAWEASPKLSFSTNAARAEANGLLKLLRERKFVPFISGWKAFEQREPLALLLRVGSYSKIFEELALSQAELASLLPSFAPMMKRYPRYRAMIQGAWGSTCARAGRFEEAVKVFEDGIKKMPRKLDLRVLYIEACLDAKRPKLALELCNAVVAKTAVPPVSVRLMLGRARLASGDVEAGAAQILKSALAPELRPSDAMIALKILCEAGQFARALKGIDGISARDPRKTDLNLECLRALAVAGQGAPAKAIALLQKLRTLCPRPEQRAIVDAGIQDVKKRFPE